MKYILDFDRDKCVGCGACAVACMDQNDIELKAGDEALRVIAHLEEAGKEHTCFMDFSMACMHCEDAPCIKGCPTARMGKPDLQYMTQASASAATAVPWPAHSAPRVLAGTAG